MGTRRILVGSNPDAINMDRSYSEKVQISSNCRRELAIVFGIDQASQEVRAILTFDLVNGVIFEIQVKGVLIIVVL
ncbi:unnamed protein product [Acidithrix sp. C25]|nr:unnamed protein product [Acidithrix sp. C25]